MQMRTNPLMHPKPLPLSGDVEYYLQNNTFIAWRMSQLDDV